MWSLRVRRPSSFDFRANAPFTSMTATHRVRTSAGAALRVLYDGEEDVPARAYTCHTHEDAHVHTCMGCTFEHAMHMPV